jgi:hypothetical protein
VIEVQRVDPFNRVGIQRLDCAEDGCLKPMSALNDGC